MNTPKIVVIFDNLGPYHVARLRALAEQCDLLAIELHGTSSDYSWELCESVPFHRLTLKSDGVISIADQLELLTAPFSPDVIFVPGWGTLGAIEVHLWASDKNIAVVVMSDTQEIDFQRNRFKEWLKYRLIRHASGALVAGTRQKAYIEKIFKDDRPAFIGYDVVDNDYFDQNSIFNEEEAKLFRGTLSLPERYVLCAARFIEKKNICSLIECYSNSCEISNDQDHRNWDLVILGDGPLRLEIEAKIAELDLTGSVHIPGFSQYSDLPKYYGLAEAFVIASETDQWGLVVNEAMASGLPVIVSSGCGCTPDLVQDGVNGFVFDPNDTLLLSKLLSRLDLASAQVRQDMGSASRARIANWPLELFANNAVALARHAKLAGARRMSLFDRFIARIITMHLRITATAQ